MQDFTKPKINTNITFKIDDDVFEAYPKIGAELMSSVMNAQNLAQVAGLESVLEENMSTDQRVRALEASQNEIQRVYQFLDQVLLPESAQRFAERLRLNGEEAIDIEQVFNVYHFLVTQYGNRPTQPPLPSRNGHGVVGTSSTAGVPPDPSNPWPSQPIGT